MNNQSEAQTLTKCFEPSWRFGSQGSTAVEQYQPWDYLAYQKMHRNGGVRTVEIPRIELESKDWYRAMLMLESTGALYIRNRSQRACASVAVRDSGPVCVTSSD